MAQSVDFDFLMEMIGQEPHILVEYLNDYRLAAVKAHGAILEAATNNNATELIALAHKFKSSSRFIGAKKLGSLCDKIERTAQELEVINMKFIITEFDEEYNAVIGDIDNFLR